MSRASIFRTARFDNVAAPGVQVAALGSPREMIEFVSGMFDQKEEDSEQLIRANLGAMRISEPWQSIAAKYFLKRAE